MKYDFNKSRYARLWLESDYLRNFTAQVISLIDTSSYWKTRYVKAANPTVKQPDGSRLYNVVGMSRPAATLMDMRADFSESIQGDTAKLMAYQGSIPSFSAESIREDAAQRDYKRMFYEQFGDDSNMLTQLINNISSRYRSANATLSNLGAQLASKGEISYNYGRGIRDQYLVKVPIPAANFKTAGAKVWSAADCNILDQMVKLENDWRLATGYEGAMSWHVSRYLFDNVIAKNAQVLSWVESYCKANFKPYVAAAVNYELFREAMAQFPNLSPIFIEDEAQQSKTIANTVSTTQGWDNNKAVLCPEGLFGEIAYSDLAEQSAFERLGASDVVKVFSPLEEGIFSLVNTTRNKGDYKEYSTEVIGNCVPTLIHFMYHVIVSVNVAD